MLPEQTGDRSPSLFDLLNFAQPEEIEELALAIRKFETGEWSPDQFKKFRLTRGTYGQRQADVNMARIKIPQGILTADQLELLGEIHRDDLRIALGCEPVTGPLDNPPIPAAEGTRSFHPEAPYTNAEAFSKAIGLGLRMPMTWRDCEIVKAASGKPGIRLHGELAAWFSDRGLIAHVTVTDESDYAAAFVVVEIKTP